VAVLWQRVVGYFQPGRAHPAMIIYTRHTRIPPLPLPPLVFGLSDTDNRSVPQRARTLTRGGDSGGGGGDCSG